MNRAGQIASKFFVMLSLLQIDSAFHSVADAEVIPGEPVDDSEDNLFVEKIFPAMRAAQCDLCHNDNGVASGYGIEFPSLSASREQILAFGYELIDYVDKAEPDQSLLIRKPTNREEHTGGQRIIPNSQQEKWLIAWVAHLTSLSDAQQLRANQLIEQAKHWSAQPLSVRRLTHSQYNNTVRDLLNDQSEPATKFPKEDYVRGFKNQIEAQGISPLQAEAYSETAERLSRSALRGGGLNNLLPSPSKSGTDAEAAIHFIRQFGRRAFRRPISEVEVSKYLVLFQRGASQSNEFNAGAQLVVEAMLQSPNFLFRVSRKQNTGLDQFGIASELSYLLWDTMPDDKMMRAAEQGKFETVAAVESQARTMLEDPRAVQSLDEFLAQWMRFEDVLNATRDRRKFREFNAEIAAAMTEETRALFRHLVWSDKNFMDFFTADYTFISTTLAKLYDLPVPLEEFSRVEYPAGSGRAGVLGHGSFMVVTSKPGETSPTGRGLFVRNHFLSQEIAPPPPGVNSVLPEIAEDKPMTNRQRLDVHLNSEACSGCHRLIDQIGFGLEQYDAIGKFQSKMMLRFGSRTSPKNVELDLDTKAYVQGIEGSDFASPKELGRILADSEICQRNIVKQYFRYAFGRQESQADQEVIETAFQRFRDSGFRFREIIVSFVTSPLFLHKFEVQDPAIQ